MAAEEHDRALAVTSHLPHMAAAALANTVPEKYFRFAGSGLLDTARLAAGDPELWRQILLQNRENVLNALEQFGGQLQALARGNPQTAMRPESIDSSPGRKRTAMLWEVDIYPAAGQPDLLAADVAAAAAELGLAADPGGVAPPAAI